MFTGIVEELGEVVAVERLPDAARLTVRGPLVTAEAAHGDSIAVNGVCLTVTDSSDKTFTADVMAETLRRTGLGGLVPGPRSTWNARSNSAAGWAGTWSRATPTAPGRSCPAPRASTGTWCASRPRPAWPGTSC